jgi:hypothetical protein
VQLDFTYENGPTLFGSHEQLLEDWRAKLGMTLAPAPPKP